MKTKHNRRPSHLNECEDVSLFDGLTEIAPCQFKDNIELTVVKIPDTITKIGTCAFVNCTNLTFVELPSSVSIDYKTFYNCPKLTLSHNDTLYKVATDLTTFETTIGVIESHAFNNCSRLTSIKLHSTEFINPHAFNNCSSLRSLTLPFSVKYISENAFSYCSSLEKLKIPFRTVVHENFSMICPRIKLVRY